MLTKRTNILFDQKTWDMLVGLAREKEYSVGELVRKAVKETYLSEFEKTAKERERAFDEIKKIRSTIQHTFTFEEIKELIEDGRKY